MIKNQNLESGVGKLKLRAKCIGPFRIIKLYPASLVVSSILVQCLRVRHRAYNRLEHLKGASLGLASKHLTTL